jgi:hypothetical protein
MLSLGIADYSVQMEGNTISLAYSRGDVSEATMVSYVSRKVPLGWMVYATKLPESYWVAKKSQRFVCDKCERIKTGPRQ